MNSAHKKSKSMLIGMLLLFNKNHFGPAYLPQSYGPIEGGLAIKKSLGARVV